MNEDILDDIHDLGESEVELSPEIIKKVNFLKIEANTKLTHLRQGRIILWAASGIILVSAIISFNMGDEVPVSFWEIAVDSLVSIGIFIGGIYWSYKKPAFAFSVALGYFFLSLILAAMVDISSLYQGIAFKLVFVIMLVRAIMAALDVNRYANMLQKLGAPVAEVDLLRDYLPVDLTPHRRDIEAN